MEARCARILLEALQLNIGVMPHRTHELIGSKRAWVGALVWLAGTACTHYQLVDERDVPGLCPSSGALGPALVADTSLVPEDSVPGLRGIVLEDVTGRPIAGAVIRAIGSTPASAHSDAAGRFRLAPVRPGPELRLDVRALGYARVEFVAQVPVKPEAALRIALTPLPTDGPCSGFAQVRVQRRWWKIW